MTGFGQMMQAYIINMRRPLFQDIRVREALVYAYDFENDLQDRHSTSAPTACSTTASFAAAGRAGRRAS